MCVCVLMPCASLYGTRDATVNLLKLAERRHAKKQAHKQRCWKKKQNWTLDFGAALHGSAKANADMLKCTGRRPALNNLTVQLCWGKLKNCVLTSSDSQHDAKDTKHSCVGIQISWASPCSETISLFSYAGEKAKCVC